MNAKIDKKDNNVITLEITVEAEKFTDALKKSYIKNASKYNIPGFRKGKAPMNTIKRHYGEEVFHEDAINICCESTYPEAIKENNILPVDYPEINIVKANEGEDFIYTAKIVARPEVELGEYKGVEVKKTKYPVSDEDIASRLKAMQEKNGRTEDKVEGGIENGDIAIIDFKGFVDDIAFEGGEGKDYSLEIGSHSFIDTFEEQLIGLKLGESKDVNVTFPEEYGKEDLNGKSAIFKVEIKGIKAKELPEIDDEFAKEVSEFDTLEELKKDIHREILQANEEKEKREYEDAVINTICEKAKVDIPEIMISKEVDIMLRDLESRLSYQGMDLKTYFAYTNSTEEKVRELMKESAEKRVKINLVIEQIVKVEEIQVTDEEILTQAEEMAKKFGSKDLEQDTKMILENQKNYLKLDVANQKAIDFVVNNSKEIA